MKKSLGFLLCACLLLSIGCAQAVSAGDLVSFGRYEQDIPGQDIEWRVLMVYGSTAALLSDRVLECMPFDCATNEWTKSSLCQWLNGTFLVNAFTKSERSIMVADSDGNYVLIPSLGDMTNTDFGFFKKKDAADSSRAARGTAHAIANGLWTNGNAGSYFTRTPSNNSNLFQVRNDGTIGNVRVDRDNVGVRPLIYVKIK